MAAMAGGISSYLLRIFAKSKSVQTSVGPLPFDCCTRCVFSLRITPHDFCTLPGNLKHALPISKAAELQGQICPGYNRVLRPWSALVSISHDINLLGVMPPASRLCGLGLTRAL